MLNIVHVFAADFNCDKMNIIEGITTLEKSQNTK
jgi:hypothetical protein